MFFSSSGSCVCSLTHCASEIVPDFIQLHARQSPVILQRRPTFILHVQRSPPLPLLRTKDSVAIYPCFHPEVLPTCGHTPGHCNDFVTDFGMPPHMRTVRGAQGSAWCQDLAGWLAGRLAAWLAGMLAGRPGSVRKVRKESLKPRMPTARPQ